jgi:hypothetical protein
VVGKVVVARFFPAVSNQKINEANQVCGSLENDATRQLTWFLAIFVLPTFGLLPIVYTLFVREKIR